jgi:hypothetical protein
VTEAADPDAPSNPYAAPSANLDTPLVTEPAHTSAAFYPMSPAKLVIMSVLTFGIYDLAFWWRQWSARRRTGEQLSVFWRTVFAGFTGFGFNNSLSVALTLRDRQLPPSLPLAPGVYLASLVVGRVIDRMSLTTALALSLTLLIGLIRASALGVIQSAVNELLELEHYKGPFNRGLTAGSIIVGLLGILLWSVAMFGALFPSELSAP